MILIKKENKCLKNYVSDRYFTRSARSAFSHILNVKKKFQALGILLPSYIGISETEGSGVFDPVRESGIPYNFYKVNQWLVPDMLDIKEKLKTGKFQLVLLIHYFGFNQINIKSFVELCHSYKAQVIEDCAHSLTYGYFGNKLGRYGDYSFYSIHKSTSTFDGGFYIDQVGDISSASLSKGNFIKKNTLINFLNTDINSISKRRIGNYHKISNLVKMIPELHLFYPTLRHGIVPLNCPIIVGNGKREKLYFELINHGRYCTALYHRLIPEIKKNKYQQSYFVSNNILNLPTHADIDDIILDKFLDILIITVKKVFNRD